MWQVTGIDGIRDDTYRVLEHDANNDLLILFRLHDGNGLETGRDREHFVKN